MVKFGTKKYVANFIFEFHICNDNYQIISFEISSLCIVLWRLVSPSKVYSQNSNNMQISVALIVSNFILAPN